MMFTNTSTQQTKQSRPDWLTVLRSFGPRLAKRIAQLPNGSISIEGYKSAKTFHAFSIPIDSAEAIASWLEQNEGNRRLAVIRAVLRSGVAPDRVRRTLHDQVNPDGVIESPFFEAVPRRWLAIDLDGISLPADIEPKQELVAYLVCLLPPQFAGADLVLQMTASAGFKPGIRARLWFWLDHPTSSAGLNRWFAGCPVDLSTFRDVQLIYTARPILEGASDPYPRRVFFLPGVKRAVEVPDLPEPPRPPVKPLSLPAHSERYVAAAVERAAEGIARAGEGSRHGQLNREAFSLARFVQSRELDESYLIARLTTAARQAGLTDPEPEITRFIKTGLDAGIHRAGGTS